MNAENIQPACTQEQVGEASVWMAMLRDPERSMQVERGFRRWLAADRGNAAAFEKVTQAWEETAGLPRIPLKVVRKQSLRPRRFLQLATLALILGSVLLYQARHAGVETDVGEQRTLTLSDGSRVFLNTDSRVVVHYDEKIRRVEIPLGEALFDVSTDSTRPFIVETAGREIRALGTSFVVRRDAQQLSVTLLDGKVAVTSSLDRSPLESLVSGGNSPSGSTSANDSHAVATRRTAAAGAPIILTPGERLTIGANSTAPAIDEPPIEKLTAWRQGKVDLANMQLADAAAEMNRYSRTKIVIEDAQTAGIRITGVFRAGDTASFASAIANTYGLQTHQVNGRILVTESSRK